MILSLQNKEEYAGNRNGIEDLLRGQLKMYMQLEIT